MTRTEELMKLAEAAGGFVWGTPEKVEAFHNSANPETIKQLVELVRLQNEVINAAAADANIYYHQDVVAQINNAIAAFNKFEQGGE